MTDKTRSAREALEEAAVHIQGARNIAEAVTILHAVAASLPKETATINAKSVICHAPGEKCLGCDHYYGKAEKCAYAQPPLESPGPQGVAEDEFRRILARYDDDEIDSREFYRSLASRLPERATPPCTYPDCEKRAALELRCLLAAAPSPANEEKQK